MKKALAVIGFFTTLVSLAQDKIKKADIQKLKDLMTGTFSSEAQSKQDTNFFNIHLQMDGIAYNETPVFWLYVEQAASASLQKPYRQRLYKVYQASDTTVASEIYELKNPQAYVGAGKNDSLKKQLALWATMQAAGKPSGQLVMKEGCTMYLKKSGDKFWGSTQGSGCPSSLRGASYATSEAVITKQGLITLDRGYDAAGKQVWGSEHGGYRFTRQ